MDQIVTELGSEGIAATGAFINHPDRADQVYWFDEVGASIPALQDTITTIEGTNVPALGYLLDCVSAAGKEFLLIDPDGYQRRKTEVGEGHDVDLSTEAGRETAKAWIRDFF